MKYKRNQSILYIAIILGLLVSSTLTGISKEYTHVSQEEFASNFIRFHVIANSDTQEDQTLKHKVRDYVLQEMSPLLQQENSIEASRKLLTAQLEDIKRNSEQVIREQGYNYDVQVTLEPTFFPTKKYGDLILPAGEYEALCIRIGEAQGQNWWCVMFPPLCFVDVTTGEIPEENKEELQQMLTTQEYNLLFTSGSAEELDVEIRFKLLEWVQNKFQ